MLELPSGLDPTATQCQTAASASQAFGARGGKWILGNYGNTLYNHFSGPMSPQLDCMNIQQQKGTTALQSQHSSVVFVAYCDGHVSSVTANVDLTTWRASGSRDGGELP